MKKIIDLLNECKCSGDDKPCKCKKGSKCDGKCSCKPVKEEVAELEEGKFDNDDDYGDYKHELKKDKELERQNDEKIAKKSKATKACACGCKDGIDGKCAECGKTLKESKFAKYLEESKLDEGVLASASPYYDKYVQSMKEKGLKAIAFNAWVDETEDKAAKGGFSDIIAYLLSTTKKKTFARPE
jgi:hypothetical protein